MLLFDPLPRLYGELEDSIREVSPASTRNLSGLVAFGVLDWGDRDVNPFVTSESTRPCSLQRAPRSSSSITTHRRKYFRLSDRSAPLFRRVWELERLLVRLQEYIQTTAHWAMNTPRWLRIRARNQTACFLESSFVAAMLRFAA